MLRKLFKIPNKPTALGWEEWKEWEKQSKKNYPIRYFLSETLFIKIAIFKQHFIKDPIYFLKCFFWYRYNIIRIRTLPVTWNDRDDVLLHGVFQILTDFIEKEKPFEKFVTKNSLNKKDWDELKEIYCWWQLRIESTKNDGNKHWDEEKRQWEKDTEMLIRLIKVRGLMWT